MANATDSPSVFARREMIVGAVTLALGAPCGAMTAESPTSGARAFLAWDMQIEIQQQDMGRLAARRGLTQEVRDLGNYLIERHQQAQQRLQEVANQLGVTLSDKLSATHLQVQRHYTAISSTSFDKAFIHHEVGDYRYFLTHFEPTATSAIAPVRAYARSEIPLLREDQSKIVALMHRQDG
jgi:putative membrane protein